LKWIIIVTTDDDIFVTQFEEKGFLKIEACNAASYFCKWKFWIFRKALLQNEMIHWLKTLRNFDGENEQRRIEQEKKTKKLLLTSRENNTLWSS